MEVVKLRPVIKSYIWGGSYFQKFGKGNEETISELWELSVRGENSSIIASGKDKNKRLDEILTKEDIGPVASSFSFFPILIKLIDAKDNLSIQVHPSDDYALKNENSFGKTEMWHILASEPGSGLYVGLNRDYSKEEIKEKLANNDLLSALNFFEVKAGETYFIPAGTIHAIGKGTVIIEIQQNSDLTYRLYDYQRKDKNGNYRQLHLEKGLEVINLKKYEKTQSNPNILAKSKYFTVEKKKIEKELVVSANKDSFISFTFVSGKGKVNDIPYQIYDTFFVPFGKEARIEGDGEIIMSYVEKEEIL